jgi:hypothetical protein
MILEGLEPPTLTFVASRSNPTELQDLTTELGFEPRYSGSEPGMLPITSLGNIILYP